MQLWLVCLLQGVKLVELNPALVGHLPNPPLAKSKNLCWYSFNMVLTFGASSEFSRDSSGFLFAFIGFRPPEVFGRVVAADADADADVGEDRSSSFTGWEPITTGTTW